MRVPACVIVMALIALGCSAAVPPSTPTEASASSSFVSSRPSLDPSTPSPSGGNTASPAGAGPPGAMLAAEGGDPVTGQLGTYTWRDGGSDSPWLPGAPIAAGAGEPLSVSLEPATPIASWRARSVPASADGPAGAASLREGAGSPRFAAPGAGAWTIEVHVVFDDGLGDASYFWRLVVR
jgi:hypothetical protein